MPPQPHVIYILSDEHFSGAMSHMGDANVRTPNLDKLAAEGVSFDRAYANCPICTPSRGTIFSGRHAHAGPVQYFFDVYKATSPSTATMLRAAGYHTAYFGKWHCGVVRDQEPPTVRANRDEYTRWPHRTPEYHRAGFQDWYGFEINNAPFQGFYYHEHEANPRKMEGYQTDFLTDLAIDYLQSYHQDKPLFLVLSVEPPHFPLEAPETFERFDPATLETPPSFADSPEMRKLLATYYAMVENLDWNIGRLREALSSLPTFADNTLTVYFSDHGDYMGTHGAINRKENPHENSVHIPAIFHWPETIPAQGRRNGLLFSLVDLFPTTLGLLGLDVPTHSQGSDFSPALRGDQNFSGPDAVLLEMSGNPRWNLDFLDWRGLVTERWKYAFYETGHELLYDLESDPHEMNNLSESDPETCREMRQRLLALLADSREPYFDVLIEHGVPPEAPVLDVGQFYGKGRLSPIWPEMVKKHEG
ncbi:sulfatase-like hydrolase/transferase [Chloroflexi bacterium TSY]|nr:sulfatase-like hydrolase/transferase [Chloroflexi bacterium TSY]